MQKPNVYLFPQLDDNYGYLIKNPHETKGVLVDPSDLSMCLKILELNDCVASHILITHHHDDHIAAVGEIKSKFNSLVIGYKNDSKIPKPDKEVVDHETFEILGNEYKVIHTPGHTLQHINFFMPQHNILFSGDTLFSIGCGRMFEGTPEVFWDSLCKIKQLPKDTKIYCGHEYTLSNLKFAIEADSSNKDLIKEYEQIKKLRNIDCPSLPSTLDRELKVNPFLRYDNYSIKNKIKKEFGISGNGLDIFTALRKWKDSF